MRRAPRPRSTRLLRGPSALPRLRSPGGGAWAFSGSNRLAKAAGPRGAEGLTRDRRALRREYPGVPASRRVGRLGRRPGVALPGQRLALAARRRRLTAAFAAARGPAAGVAARAAAKARAASAFPDERALSVARRANGPKTTARRRRLEDDGSKTTAPHRLAAAGPGAHQPGVAQIPRRRVRAPPASAGRDARGHLCALDAACTRLDLGARSLAAPSAARAYWPKGRQLPES